MQDLSSPSKDRTQDTEGRAPEHRTSVELTPSTFKELYGSLESTWMIQENPPILRPADHTFNSICDHTPTKPHFG